MARAFTHGGFNTSFSTDDMAIGTLSVITSGFDKANSLLDTISEATLSVLNILKHPFDFFTDPIKQMDSQIKNLERTTYDGVLAPIKGAFKTAEKQILSAAPTVFDSLGNLPLPVPFTAAMAQVAQLAMQESGLIFALFIHHICPAIRLSDELPSMTTTQNPGAL